jgi:hypothetical protein
VDKLVLGHEPRTETPTVQVLLTIGGQQFRITKSGDYTFPCGNAADKKEKVRIELKVGDQVVK